MARRGPANSGPANQIGCRLAGSITEVRDLRTGVPVWARYPQPAVHYSALASPIRTDVVVVGSGITGALAAQTTTAMGLQTVVLDRRPPAHGSTAASTALVQFEIDTPLVHLADELGMERAARIWLRAYRAVGDLVGIIRHLHIPCNLRARRALYLAGNTLDADAIAAEYRLRHSIDLPSRFLDHAELKEYSGLERSAALLSDGAADVDPSSLTAGLLNRAIADGCRLFSPAQLAEVVPLQRRVEMVTDTGVELEAKALVFATGYELAKGVPASGHRRTSTWAFATRPQPERLRNNANVVWEASVPYLYVRSTMDGRIVVGGEDEEIDDEIARDNLLPAKIAALQIKANELMPWLDINADCAWAGTFGESDNGLPSIGQVPGMPSCYAVLGYGGNGITFAMIAAQILGAQLQGQRDSDAELFEFGR